MKRILARLWASLDLRDALVLIGIGATSYGLGLAYPPAGWTFAGLAAFWLGIRKPGGAEA